MTTKKSLPIDKQINLLLKLQAINQENRILQEDISLLNKELLDEKKKLEIKENQYNKHYPYLQKIEKEHLELEEEIKIINQKIERNEEIKKKIKTIKEFKAVNKEIEYLIKESAIKETELLNKINGLEFKQEKIKTISEMIVEIKKNIELKETDVSVLQNERQEMINQKLKEKEALEKKLPQTLIKIFNRIYHNREQKAIVPIVDQICHGCYIKIPLQEEFDIKKGDKLSYCPYCSRILYIQE